MNRTLPILALALSGASAVAYPLPPLRVSAPRFQADELKAPPLQAHPWTPPTSTVPDDFVAQARASFKDGLADPRECEYREIDVSTPDQPSFLGRPAGECLATGHGWVLPVAANDRYRFAIQWDGLVHPIFAVGKEVSLAADVRTAIRKQREESDSLLFHRKPTPRTLIALLLRGGEGQLASEAWKAFGSKSRSIDLRDEWLQGLSARAMRDHMRGDDRLALSRLRMLARIPGMADDLQLLPDQERRARERAEDPPRAPQIRGSLEALIEDLDDVATQPSGLDIPSAPQLDQDPRVKALIRKGPAAIPALAKCMASDQRLTRSNELSWGGTLSNKVVPVAKAAHAALRTLLEPQPLDEIEQRVEIPADDDCYAAAVGQEVLAWLEKQAQGPPGKSE